MWDPPGPGTESLSPASPGRFFTTEPPGKPLHDFLLVHSFITTEFYRHIIEESSVPLWIGLTCRSTRLSSNLVRFWRLERSDWELSWYLIFFLRSTGTITNLRNIKSFSWNTEVIWATTPWLETPLHPTNWPFPAWIWAFPVRGMFQGLLRMFLV